MWILTKKFDSKAHDQEGFKNEHNYFRKEAKF